MTLLYDATTPAALRLGLFIGLCESLSQPESGRLNLLDFIECAGPAAPFAARIARASREIADAWAAINRSSETQAMCNGAPVPDLVPWISEIIDAASAYLRLMAETAAGDGAGLQAAAEAVWRGRAFIDAEGHVVKKKQ